MTQENKKRVSAASPEALEAMTRIEAEARAKFRAELEQEVPAPSTPPVEAVELVTPAAAVEREVRQATFSIPVHREELVTRPTRIGNNKISHVRGPSPDAMAKADEARLKVVAEQDDRQKHNQEVQRFLQPHSLYGTLQAQARLIDKLTKKVDSLTRAVKKLNTETTND